MDARRTMVSPDLLVMPPGWDIPDPPADTGNKRTIRLDRGDPTPSGVVGVLSASTVDKDFNAKWRLYALLGIPEYLIVGIGSKGTGLGFWLYRLDVEGNYRLWGAEGDTAPRMECVFCGVHLRLQNLSDAGRPVPYVLQWRDPHTGHWHDYIGDIEARGEVQNALAFLDGVLPNLSGQERTALMDLWLESGVPRDLPARIFKIRDNPDQWQARLGLASLPNVDAEAAGESNYRGGM